MPKSRGFTLIELLVVISIIAILSIIGIVVFTGIQKSSRDARRISDIDAIMKALEVYYTIGYGPILDSWFAGGKVPRDPLSSGYGGGKAQTQWVCGSGAGGKPCVYCMQGFGEIEGCTITYIQSGRPISPVPSLTICANLETSAGSGGNHYYCRQTQQ